MTDKKHNFVKDINVPSKEQIIIDGVDVSKCEFYNPHYCGMHIDGYGDSEGACRDYEDCYFKQLTRKTQEHNELLEQHKQLDDRVNRMIEEKYQLGRECEELKEENEKLKMQLCNDCGEKDDYNIPCKAIRDLDYELQIANEKNAHYSTALDEIKSYQERNCETCHWTKTEKCDSRCQVFVILDIINKAKGEGNAR